MDQKDEYITLSRYCNEVRDTQRPINHHYMRAALETRDDVRRIGNYMLAPRSTFDAIYAQWEKWSAARQAEIRSWRREHCKNIASISRGGSAKVRSDTLDLLLREIIELLKNTKR